MTPPVRELVGRDADLARIAELIGLDDPRGVGVVVSGDAGIGKSALLARVSADAETAGWQVAWGHCVGQSGSGVALLPFTELVGRLHQLAPDTVADVATTRPALRALVPDRRGGTTEQAQPGQVGEAVHALLTAIGEQGPLLVVVEDVHWADHSSRDLLTLLLTRGFSGPVALVVTYRSDDLHRQHPLHETLAVWARIAGVSHLSLEPLQDSAIRDLVAQTDATLNADLDEATAAEITHRAEGNPFFAEELTASTIAGKPITGGLSRVLWARVDQLSEVAQHVVRTMAVGGRTTSHDLLARLVDLTDDELDRAVAEAVERHVIETRWPPAYAFRHALLAETTTADLLPGQRMRLHRAYAAALTDDPSLGPASELARHAAAAGDLATAVAAARTAARADLAVGGPVDALAQLEQALCWLNEDALERDEVSLEASDAALAAGDVVRAVHLLQDRLDHPGPDQAPAMRARLLATCANRARLVDMPPADAGLAMTTEALGLVPDDDRETRLVVLMAHMQQLVDTRDYAAAAALGEEASTLADTLGRTDAHTEIRTIQSRVIEIHDDLDALAVHLDGLLRDLGGRPDPLLVRIHHQGATMHHRRGELRRALESYDASAALAHRLRLDWAPFGMEARLIGGLTAYELGDWDGAEHRLDVADPLLPQPGRSFFEAALMLVRAGRGEGIGDDEIDAVRSWWHVDGLAVVLLAMPSIEHFGNHGALDRALDIAQDSVARLDRTWGRYHAVVRLAALLAGQVATHAPTLDGPTLRRADALLESLTERVDVIIAQPQRGAHDGAVNLPDTNTETWAWNQRLRAELLRIRWRTPSFTSPPLEDLRSHWQDSVAAFDRYGHVFEAARSRARLAAVLRASGDIAGARREEELARGVGERLGATPLLHELDTLATTSSTTTADDPNALTPREQEVLELVARGLSNGQVGTELFISTKTASVHVSRILAKLGASSRTEAAAVARDRGLVP
ncbi:regulatory LuxR family protein [Knoellia remsis]|uniref:Regulatory LuxR family protein n=1 Tax=Knoellia remsis TaxID=407159 RepID=A0A2T0UGL4_9MICO|nr:helix-turn-helix transcriptional regulator [Knoellia remsis]PRY57052.1 regulatory LuxR family protein [Knoellia remsis]